MPSLDPRALRFFWPQTVSFDGKIRRLSDDAVADLNLAVVVSSLAGTHAPARRRQARERFNQRILTEVVCQQELIVPYRFTRPTAATRRNC